MKQMLSKISRILLVALIVICIPISVLSASYTPLEPDKDGDYSPVIGKNYSVTGIVGGAPMFVFGSSEGIDEDDPVKIVSAVSSDVNIVGTETYTDDPEICDCVDLYFNSAGTATVTVTDNNGNKSIIKVNVLVNSVIIKKTKYTLDANATKTQKISLGAEAKYRDLKYTSSNSKFKISSDGVVTVPKNFVGKATITIKAVDPNGIIDTVSTKVTINVNKVPATKIRLAKSARVTKKFKLTLEPKCSYSCEKLTGLKWKSSNKKVATVNSKGVVTGKKKGTAIITCTLKNNKKYNCKVKVRENKLFIETLSDCEFNGADYGYVYASLLDAHYSGKKLIANFAVYNNRVFYASKFKWIKLKVKVNGKVVKTYKLKNVPIKLSAYNKKKMTFKIPMSKVYDIAGLGQENFDVYVDDYYYTYTY